jgi:hypothetical protein
MSCSLLAGKHLSSLSHPAVLKVPGLNNLRPRQFSRRALLESHERPSDACRRVLAAKSTALSGHRWIAGVEARPLQLLSL